MISIVIIIFNIIVTTPDSFMLCPVMKNQSQGRKFEIQRPFCIAVSASNGR